MKLDIINSLHMYEKCKEEGTHLTRVTILFNHGQDINEDGIRDNLKEQLDQLPYAYMITEVEREI